MRLKVGGRGMTMSALSPGTPELETPFWGFKPRRRFKLEQRGTKQEGGVLMFAPAEAKRPHYDSCARLTVEAIKDFIAAAHTRV